MHLLTNLCTFIQLTNTHKTLKNMDLLIIAIGTVLIFTITTVLTLATETK